MEELQVIETTSGRQFKPWASKEDVQAIGQAVEQAVQDPESVTGLVNEIASGKQAIASAINAKGGQASLNQSFSELADDIVNLNDSFITYGVEVTEKIHWLRFICDAGIVPRLPLTAIDDDVVTGISTSYTFKSCSALESVKMTALTTISGVSVFYQCSALQSVNMPNLKTISGGNVFYLCSALQSVNMPNLKTISGASAFRNTSQLQSISLPSLEIVSNGNANESILVSSGVKYVYFPKLNTVSYVGLLRQCPVVDIQLGTLVQIHDPLYDVKPNLRNITIGQDTNINLPFQYWTATNVISEGQSGIDELNTNLYNNLLTKLYDHSQDGQTRTLRIGWLANVTAENIAYANAKGWTLTT